MNFYPGGSPIVRVTCKTELGVATDPTGLTVTVTDPTGTTLQTWTIGQLTHEATGVYKCPSFTVTAEGWHRIGVVATGAVADVNYTRFLVVPAP